MSIWSIEVLKYWRIEVLKYWCIKVLSILLSIFAYFWYLLWYYYFALFLVLLDRICVVFCVQLAVVVLVFMSRLKDK